MGKAKAISAAALVALGFAGGLYTKTGEVVTVAEEKPGFAAVATEDAEPVLAAMVAAGVKDGDKVYCSCGLTLDGVWRDDLENCSDGKGAAFQRPCGGGSVLVARDGALTKKENQ